jgi:predicted AAA+ superfamily ATPase
MKKLERTLPRFFEELALKRRKMVFLSGPRQVGKSTLAKTLLKTKLDYFNWDEPEFRKRWLKGSTSWGESLLETDISRIVIDEFHKNPKWKNQLKGFYDRFGEQIEIIVTGSARLNIYRKGADSLMGRFAHFHVHPFTLGELYQSEPLSYKDFLNWLTVATPVASTSRSRDLSANLLKWSGFPEPFLAQSEAVHRIWSKGRIETMIRQDLRETSHLLQTSQVEILASFLPERVGSPLSVSALREDLDVAHTTITRWLASLENVYYHFSLSPFSRSIPRSLKKEAKVYLYDWTSVEEKGPRFENMVACHLKKMVDFYSDCGEADLKLSYLRDKEKNEVDFIVLDKNRPLFTVEAKVSERHLDPSYKKFQKHLGVPHFQIIEKPGIYQSYFMATAPKERAAVISFDRFFSQLP